MPDKPASAPDAPKVACDICRKEVPLTAAFTPEGAEYVEHFCGIECYQQFVAEAKQREKGGGDAKP